MHVLKLVLLNRNPKRAWKGMVLPIPHLLHQIFSSSQGSCDVEGLPGSEARVHGLSELPATRVAFRRPGTWMIHGDWVPGPSRRSFSCWSDWLSLKITVSQGLGETRVTRISRNGWASWAQSQSRQRCDEVQTWAKIRRSKYYGHQALRARSFSYLVTCPGLSGRK